jgi:hypothetical protein
MDIMNGVTIKITIPLRKACNSPPDEDMAFE